MENMEPGRIGTPFQFSIPVDVVKIGEATQVRVRRPASFLESPGNWE